MTGKCLKALYKIAADNRQPNNIPSLHQYGEGSGRGWMWSPKTGLVPEPRDTKYNGAKPPAQRPAGTSAPSNPPAPPAPKTSGRTQQTSVNGSNGYISSGNDYTIGGNGFGYTPKTTDTQQYNFNNAGRFNYSAAYNAAYNTSFNNAGRFNYSNVNNASFNNAGNTGNWGIWYDDSEEVEKRRKEREQVRQEKLKNPEWVQAREKAKKDMETLGKTYSDAYLDAQADMAVYSLKQERKKQEVMRREGITPEEYDRRMKEEEAAKEKRWQQEMREYNKQRLIREKGLTPEQAEQQLRADEEARARTEARWEEERRQRVEESRRREEERRRSEDKARRNKVRKVISTLARPVNPFAAVLDWALPWT